MSRKNQLSRSGARLQQRGALWLQQTRDAGGTFVEESMAASVAFARDMSTARSKLLTEWRRSTRDLRRALTKEAHDWQKLVLKTRDGYVAAFMERVRGLEEQAVHTREALKPEAVEVTVLESTRQWLERAQTSVDARIEKTGQQEKAAPKVKAVSQQPVRSAGKKSDVPIRNYDQLTARDVVSRVQRLSGPQATAVLDYERARKKRSTVIRAAQKRLAIAS